MSEGQGCERRLPDSPPSRRDHGALRTVRNALEKACSGGDKFWVEQDATENGEKTSVYRCRCTTSVQTGYMGNKSDLRRTGRVSAPLRPSAAKFRTNPQISSVLSVLSAAPW